MEQTALSNLQRIVPAAKADETAAERRLRLQLAEDHAFHQRFWQQNNTDYTRVRERLPIFLLPLLPKATRSHNKTNKATDANDCNTVQQSIKQQTPASHHRLLAWCDTFLIGKETGAEEHWVSSTILE